MATKTVELTVSDIVSNGYRIGMANYLSLFAAMVLWALTFWIPYINVGTTIALMTLPIAMSEGRTISPLEIFDSRYRQFMGEMFIQGGLKAIGTLMGFYFLVIPGLVLKFSWYLSELLLVDKQMNPTEVLSESNKRMAGHKWTVFFGELLIGLTIALMFLVLGGVYMLLGSDTTLAYVVSGVLYVLLVVLAVSVGMGAKAYVYQILK